MPQLVHYTLLGNPLALNTWGCGLSDTQEQWVIALWNAAVEQINEKSHLIPDNVKEALAKVQEIIVPVNPQALGDTGRNPADGLASVTFSLEYLEACTTIWVATCLAHEGGHVAVTGKYSGDDLWQSEEYACQMQLSLAQVLGMDEASITYLQQWMKVPDNISGMQQHMVKGYAGPPLAS